MNDAPEHPDPLPLHTDDDIIDRVADIVGTACTTQLWPMLVDEHDIQLPQLTQIETDPSPDASSTEMLASIAAALHDSGIPQMVLVIERRGAQAPTPDDLAWLDAARRGFADSTTRLRAVVVSHTEGVSLIHSDAADRRRAA